jgi:DNA-binding CsgD family transcriptional regulator
LWVNHNAADQSERGGVDLAALSEREREVLDLALMGLSARAMADRLTLTEATIRSHLSRIYAKVGVSGRVELLAQLGGRPTDQGSPPSSPPVQPAPPRRRRVWPVVTALAVPLVIVSAGALFLWLRPDLPPSTNLATVSQIVDQEQATSLDLRGDTLFVTTADGRHYRVDGVGQAAFGEIALRAEANIGATVEVSISRGDSLTPASIVGIVSAFAPLILLVAVALVIFRRLHRPPRLSPAS